MIYYLLDNIVPRPTKMTRLTSKIRIRIRIMAPRLRKKYLRIHSAGRYKN
jgi:hypothetical protein